MVDSSINYLIARGNVPPNKPFDYNEAVESGLKNELYRQQLATEPYRQKLEKQEMELRGILLQVKEEAMKASQLGGPVSIDIGTGTISAKNPARLAQIAAYLEQNPQYLKDPKLPLWLGQEGISWNAKEAKAPLLGTPEHLEAIKQEEEARAKIRQKYKEPEKENEATAAMKTFEMQRWGRLVPEKRGTPEYLEALKESKRTPYTDQLEAQAKRAAETHKQSIRKEFYDAAEVKTYQTLSQQFGVMEEAMKESKKSGNLVAVDQALITIMNKMMDPQSVVRESEYARTPGDLALMNRVKGAFQKLAKGGAGLTQEDREAISTMGKKYYEVSQRKYKAKYHEYAGYAVNAGYEPDQVLNPADKGQTGVQNPGDVEDGYRWKGGDKSDPDNWEPVK